MRVARNGYASSHLVIDGIKSSEEYSLDMSFHCLSTSYREWFHFNKPDQRYYPDALIPVKIPFRSRIPDPDHHIPNQTAAAFWLDIWIPADTTPNLYRGKIRLRSGNESKSIPIELSVLA